jgi:membrane protein required for colicin V production
MPALDWIFALVLLASLALGVWRGLVYEILSMLNWVAAFILAQWLAPQVAQYLPLSGAGEGVRYAAGFAVVFVVSVLVGGVLAVLGKKLLAAAGLAPVDRTLGAAFGFVRGVVVLLAVTVVVHMTPLKSGAWWQESTGASISTAALKGLKPVLPEQFAKYLPS